MTSPALAVALAAVGDVRRFVSISEREVEAVRQLLSLDPAWAGRATDWALDVASFRNGKKYDYACAVVMLYGALERFVEDSLEEHISSLCRAAERYSELPEKMRASHFAHALAHLQRTKDSRYDGISNAAQLATALSRCLQDSVPYEFISESMLHHAANFRPAVVDEFFGRVGVDSVSRRAVASEAFAGYLDAYGISAPVERPEAVLDLISELVSRRNEVSHGDIRNTLAPSELIPYCDQVEAYCKALASVLDDSLLGYLAQFYGVDHGNPIVVHNHNIVCFQSKGASISVGDRLAIQRVDGSWYRAAVLRIQINKTDVTSVPIGQDLAVGIQIDGRCKQTYVIRSGVFDRKPSFKPSASTSGPSAPSLAETLPVFDVEVLKARRDEALAWLQRNGGAGQGAWLETEYQRYCDALALLEQPEYQPDIE